MHWWNWPPTLHSDQLTLRQMTHFHSHSATLAEKIEQTIFQLKLYPALFSLSFVLLVNAATAKLLPSYWHVFNLSGSEDVFPVILSAFSLQFLFIFRQYSNLKFTLWTSHTPPHLLLKSSSFRQQNTLQLSFEWPRARVCLHLYLYCIYNKCQWLLVTIISDIALCSFTSCWQ